MMSRIETARSRGMKFGIAAVAMFGLFACAGGADAAGVDGGATQAGAGIPNAQQVAAGTGTMTLALKFVEFTQGGKPVATQDTINKVVAGINQLYAQCNLKVKAEQVTQVDPAQYGLTYSESSMDVMEKIRTPFDDAKYLVVTDTGAWDHAAMGPANAWTAMPGQSPSGAVLESLVADNGNITAHELGHYLNLDHVSDESNMMNPIIYDASTHITSAQCQEMRNTAATVRAQALRSN
jgi:hypothetical protein